ncbi:zinc dependent phospholipase C family protein [Pseudodesulfovibrio pelocollis]|uniref:zinc dependent phospholipase C family protein n=1 Tax=Pseudodesulfovibrio pelocollis TaxID=3051432 RepID=UPI00255B25B5|nr:zinc dependent phospholipase C family protein [Pseudodesulfovibrio sp. SB368]
MPKDLIHFDIAGRTARLLAQTRFGPCLSAEGHGLHLGSVFHDALFYAAWPGDAPLERLAHTLHGARGEDTFALVRMLAAHARTDGSPLAAAVLVGVVSHLFADTVMHPLVWHLTGDYYASDATARSMARQRHRALESLMDMVACPHMLGRTRYRLGLMLRRCPALLERGLPVAGLAAMAGMEPDATRAGLARAWRIFALFQAAYSNRPLARAAFALRPRLPRAAAELAALAYAPQLLRQAQTLAGPIAYRHPVTGETLTATLDQLMDEAAQRAAALCLKLEPAIFDSDGIDLDEMGPSMDAGLPGVESDRMRHFASPPFPELA